MSAATDASQEEALRRADAQARSAALDPGRSILLQAPAGSGKTAVLTQRFLRLLAQVDEPGAILAITFTRKAAAEMRGRVIRALRGELEADDPNTPLLRQLAGAALAHGAARGWRLLEDPGVLRIQTIDSFDYWLASQLPVAARAGGALAVTERPDELYRAAARRTLSGADADPTLAEDAALLFERFDNNWNQLEHALAQMLRERAQWLRHVLEQDPRLLLARVNATLKRSVGERVQALQRLVPEPLRRLVQALPATGQLGAEAEHLGAWQGLARCVLTEKGNWRVVVQARHLPPAYQFRTAQAALRACIALLEHVAGLQEALREVRRLPAPALNEADARALAALARILRRAAAELQVGFAESGSVDYTYVTGAARQALSAAAEPTDLALRTGLALRHILVDEFQDTSLAQFQLLEQLTAGWEEGDGRTLFVVGDPMQSIYRFRDAEVGLFIAAREYGIGTVRLTPLRLTRNFRTGPALVAWTNATFAQLLAPHDDLREGAVAFSASVSARTSAPGDAAASLQLFPGDRAREAEALAAQVAGLRAADPAATIAVLVAAHAHAGPIVSALRGRGIEPLGVDLVPLAERPIVRDLVQLCCALHDLADRSAWLAVLRAPWCGVRLATLTELSRARDPLLVWEALHAEERLARCAPAERARLLRARAVLGAALAQRAGTVADWLERSWLRLGASDAYGLADLDDAYAFFSALAARAAAGEWRAPGDFPALLRDLYSAPRSAGRNAVQIMTIHRAKGLEFDHVFVPALERATDQRGRRLLSWVDLPRGRGAGELLMAAAPAITEEGTPPDLLSGFIGAVLRVRADHERRRLMYVAATRARRTLQLSGAPPQKEDGSIAPDRRSLLGCLWPALQAAFRVVPAPAASMPMAAALPLRRLREAWQAPQLPAAPERPRLPLAHAALAPQEFSWVGETQRHIGTIVHAWLARAAQSGLAGEAQSDFQHEPLEAELRRHGVASAERAAAARVIAEALTRTLADERGRWILGAHREAHCELPLTGLSAGRLRSVVIDRCFVDEDGTRWVIDYKTSRHEGGALEQFLEQEMQRYQEQLVTYASLARALGPQPVRAALYFPLLGVLREL